MPKLPRFNAYVDPKIINYRRKAGEALNLPPNHEFFYEIIHGYILHYEKYFPKGTPINEMVDSLAQIPENDKIAKLHFLEQRLKELDDGHACIVPLKLCKKIVEDGVEYIECPVGPRGLKARILSVHMRDKSRADTDISRRKARSLFNTKKLMDHPDHEIPVYLRIFLSEEFIAAQLATHEQLARAAYFAFAQGHQASAVCSDVENAFPSALLDMLFVHQGCILIGDLVMVFYYLGQGHPESSGTFHRMNFILWKGMSIMDPHPEVWFVPIVPAKLALVIKYDLDSIVVLDKTTIHSDFADIFCKNWNYDPNLIEQLKVSVDIFFVEILENGNFVLVINSLFLYLDDTTSFFVSLKQGDHQLTGHTQTFPKLGKTIAKKKTKFPVIRIFELLGLNYNFVIGICSITDKKLQKIILLSENVFSTTFLIPSVLLQTYLGNVVYVAYSVAPALKCFFRAGYVFLRGQDLDNKFLMLPKFSDKKSKKVRPITKRFYLEIIMVLTELLTKPFITFEQLGGLYKDSSVDQIVLSDASGKKSAGWGGFQGQFYTYCKWTRMPNWLVESWFAQFEQDPEKLLSSTPAEDLGALLVFVTLVHKNYRNGSLQPKTTICVNTDNLGNSFNWNKFRSRSNPGSAKALENLLECIDCTILAAHRYRRFNTSSDNLSKSEFSQMPFNASRTARLIGHRFRSFVPPNYRLLKALLREESLFSQLLTKSDFSKPLPLHSLVMKAVKIKLHQRTQLYKNYFEN